MLATIHHHIAASCAVFAQEHADDTYDPPLSGTAATPHPLSSPPVGGTSLGRLHQHTLADSESYLSDTAMQARWFDCRTVTLYARRLPSP